MGNKILVIEDDEPIAELLEMNLSAAGYDVTVCLDGLTAESLLRNSVQADLALVDIMLLGKDGFELISLKAPVPFFFQSAMKFTPL